MNASETGRLWTMWIYFNRTGMTKWSGWCTQWMPCSTDLRTYCLLDLVIPLLFLPLFYILKLFPLIPQLLVLCRHWKRESYIEWSIWAKMVISKGNRCCEATKIKTEGRFAVGCCALTRDSMYSSIVSHGQPLLQRGWRLNRITGWCLSIWVHLR